MSFFIGNCMSFHFGNFSVCFEHARKTILIHLMRFYTTNAAPLKNLWLKDIKNANDDQSVRETQYITAMNVGKDPLR